LALNLDHNFHESDNLPENYGIKIISLDLLHNHQQPWPLTCPIDKLSYKVDIKPMEKALVKAE